MQPFELWCILSIQIYTETIRQVIWDIQGVRNISDDVVFKKTQEN